MLRRLALATTSDTTTATAATASDGSCERDNDASVPPRSSSLASAGPPSTSIFPWIQRQLPIRLVVILFLLQAVRQDGLLALLRRNNMTTQASLLSSTIGSNRISNASNLVGAKNQTATTSTNGDETTTTTNTSSQVVRMPINVTFFYNIFIHPRKKPLQEHAVKVIVEQLRQIGQSHVLTLYHPSNNEARFPFHYNTVGLPPNHTWIQELAAQNGLHAIRGQHVPRAHEETTLQPLHDFCRAHPDRAVIYVHNKGSLHKGNGDNEIPQNGRWNQESFRRLLTLAATHETCLETILRPEHSFDVTTINGGGSNNNNGICQVCGLLLQPLPSIHFPGNMWVARCSYIQHLAPPASMRTKMAEVNKMFLRTVKPTGLLNDTYFPPKPRGVSPAAFGLDRYALEHWVGSHPQLSRPCHISPQPGFDDLTINRETLIPDWEVKLVGNGSPGFPLDHSDWHYHHYIAAEYRQELLSNETRRKTEYFFLPGFLFKWQSLYQLAPPLDSWVWNWFPDGEYWKSQLDTHALLTTDWVAFRNNSQHNATAGVGAT